MEAELHIFDTSSILIFAMPHSCLLYGLNAGVFQERR